MPSRVSKEPSLQQVLDAGLRLLSYRPRSEAELRLRLSGRYPAPLLEDAILRLKERQLLDDAAFARFWLKSREEHRPKGAYALKWELLRMGVSREVASEALEGIDEEDNAFRAASSVLRKLKKTDYNIFRKKVVPYLRRRGFSTEVTNRIVRRLWEGLPDPVNGSIEGHEHHQQPEDIGH